MGSGKRITSGKVSTPACSSNTLAFISPGVDSLFARFCKTLKVYNPFDEPRRGDTELFIPFKQIFSLYSMLNSFKKTKQATPKRSSPLADAIMKIDLHKTYLKSPIFTPKYNVRGCMGP